MTPEEWLAQSYDRADKLLEIEIASAAVGDPIDRALAELTKELARRYITAFGSIYARNVDKKALAPILLWLADELRNVSVRHVEKSIIKTARAAWTQGHVGAYIGLRKQPPKPKQIRLSPEVRGAAKDAEISAKDRLESAAQMVENAERWGDLTKSMAKAKQAANVSRGAAAWATNRSSTDAVRAVERKQSDVKRVWIAERDACVHCIAYAGETASGKGTYAGGLTYGDKPITEDPVWGPPLHGHCRCHEELIATDDELIPDALKREARRSVAKGWSLESESLKQRLRATERLLAMNPRLPKSVIAEARRAIKKGEYRSRQVPTGNRQA